MSQSMMRRIGALMVAVLLLSVVLVPAAAAAPVAGKAESASEAAGCPVYHRVVRGDNLTVLAWRYGVTVNQIMRWNNIYNPDRIYVGQVLVIWPPRCTTPAPKPPKPPAPKPPPLPGPCSGNNCQPAPNPAAWRVTYFNTPDLTGPVIVDRQEHRPCFNCGFGAPVPGVNADRWSARWSTSSYAVGGTYRLNVKADDGVRVFIDGVPVLNEWRVQAVRGFFVDVVIPRGWHTWTVEYFEDTGVSEMCFEAVLLR